MSASFVPVVAIPAKNEQVLLPRLIAALARQTALSKLHHPLQVVLVINNSDDGSLATALEAARRHTATLQLTIRCLDFPSSSAHVGSARRLAMDIAASREPSGVILTTDADAVPADDWVEQNLAAIALGADLVGGRIVGDKEEELRLGDGFLRRAHVHARYQELCDELAWLIDPLDHDPWPRHHDHTGASIAVRTTVYRAVGGMDPLPLREDIAFVSKARAAGFRLRHAPEVTVTVSARTHGRARGGMADCLKNWIRAEADGLPVLVDSPREVERRLRLRRALRDLGDATPEIVEQTFDHWGIASPYTQMDGGHLSICTLIEQLAGDVLDAPETEPAANAIAMLECRIAELRGIAHAA
ncbi:glycosyltransferase [Oryzicola mucosus]|uniref:Glycosyltransferase n=1 Tax=Oryzicola mucosus TaxID=2767425 RepID=A0A8J6TYS5_9HYPH|nr:glycosyltransferase [Oryzicola mucosus]MBD0415269.1 glycosyltransferase [Oryzicola mucosus]